MGVSSKYGFNTVLIGSILIATISKVCAATNSEFIHSNEMEYKCEPFQEAFICSDAPYNATMLPNAFGHQSLSDIQSAMNDFIPLIATNCSVILKEFLCFVFAPPCTQLGKIIPVCRPFCEEAATQDCTDILKEYKQNPEVLQCNNYPKSGLCIGQNNEISPNSELEEDYFPEPVYYPEKEVYFTDKTALGSREGTLRVLFIQIMFYKSLIEHLILSQRVKVIKL